MDCGYENPIRIENNFTSVNDLLSAQTTVLFPHSQFFTEALKEIVINLNNIPMDSLIHSPMKTPMKTPMKNVIKTLVQNATKTLGQKLF